MKLITDFHDYYDHMFDNEGDSWYRMSIGYGPSKRWQLKIIEDAGYKTPPHGTVGEILDKWWTEENRWIRDVIAYEDETAHCGEGKRRLDHGHFQRLECTQQGGPELWRLAHLYCTAMVTHRAVGNKYNPAISWRRLQIGKRVFWIETKGYFNWMSNCGDGESQVIGEETCKDFFYEHYPISAIDFVIGKEMYGVDFNTAPGIKGSGVEHIFPAYQVVDEIEEWFLGAKHSYGN